MAVDAPRQRYDSARFGPCFGRILAVLLGLSGVLPDSPAAAEELIGAAEVVDGDTLKIAHEKVRLHGIDAPETSQTCGAAGGTWPCGRMATASLKDAVAGQTITCKGGKRDRYGRLIAICFLGQADLNAQMVRDGWALAYRRYALDYVADEMEARAQGRGLWQGPFTAPWEWRQTAQNTARE
jgi:endonuclease YncB( thermonuclease family)